MSIMRTVKSFVRRQGRLTGSQQQALEALYPIYSFTKENIQQLFDKYSNIIVEIGFGAGDSLLSQAQQEPHHTFLGIEVYKTGIGKVLLGIKATEINNLYVMEGDALEIFTSFPEDKLTGIQIYFPDPWPKKKHHKRRLIREKNLALFSRALIPETGWLHIATDWQPYAKEILAVCNQYPTLVNANPEQDFIEKPARRPDTRFEARGENLGHKIYDLLYFRR